MEKIDYLSREMELLKQFLQTILDKNKKTTDQSDKGFDNLVYEASKIINQTELLSLNKDDLIIELNKNSVWNAENLKLLEQVFILLKNNYPKSLEMSTRLEENVKAVKEYLVKNKKTFYFIDYEHSQNYTKN